MLLEATEQLPQSQYPVIRTIAAHERILRRFSNMNDPRFGQISTQLLDYYLVHFATENLKGLDRRVALHYYTTGRFFDSLEMQKRLVEQLEKQGGEPWLVHMISGRYRIKAAWAARGSGWAHQVEDQQWEGFFEHLAAAREHLVNAYELEPTYPESAAAMITVIMGAGGVPGESMRTWFDRAAEAQIDYMDAYTNLLWGLRPRWHGSIPEMLAFGQECADTGRFDTSVPFMFIRAIESVIEDRDGETRIWSEPRVYGKVVDVLVGYTEAEPDRASWYRAYNAGIAWHAGDYPAAARIIEQLGDEADPANPSRLVIEGLDRAQVVPTRVIAAVRLLGGPHAADALAAEQAQRARQYGEAIQKYEALIAKLEANDPGQSFARSRRQEIDWYRNFEKGQWVSIQPDTKFTGWHPVAGKWSVENDGTLVGEMDQYGLLIICGADFGTRYELSGIIEIIRGNEQADPKAGFAVAYQNGSNHFAMLMNERRKRLWTRHPQWEPAFPAPIARENAVQIQMWDLSVAADINGQQVLHDHRLHYGFVSSARTHVGIMGSEDFRRPATVRVRDLRIRKLQQPPGKMTDPILG
jgi:hypothetical protein